MICVWTTPDKSFLSLMHPHPSLSSGPTLESNPISNLPRLHEITTPSVDQPLPLPATTNPPTAAPSLAPLLPASSLYSEEMLLSLHRPVKSDVWGNLGPPSVVTDESVEDWLKDRWQAALNMRGEPIPGSHWLEIDLLRECCVTKFLIDWEVAHSTRYEIWGSRQETQGMISDLHHGKHPGWYRLAISKNRKEGNRDKHHIVHEVEAWSKYRCHDEVISEGERGYIFRFIRLVILTPETQWGSSVWRFQVWGREYNETAI